MSRRLVHVGIVFLALYGLLFFRLEMVQVVNAKNLRNDPLNTREIMLNFDQPRGLIQTADGEIIPQTVAVCGPPNRLRQYPYGSLHSQAGVFLPADHGATVIERSHNLFLA